MGRATRRKESASGRRRSGEKEDFGVAFGVDVVVDGVRTVRSGDREIHELRSFFGGAEDETGFERDIGNRFVGAASGAESAELMQFEIFGRGVFGGRFLFEDGLGKNYGAGFARACGAAGLVIDVG